jgi:hypothetical protein
LVTKKEHSTHFEVWDDQDKQQLAYRTYSKEEMEALRRAKKKVFFTLSPWAVIGAQMAVTVFSALCWSFFGNPIGVKPLYLFGPMGRVDRGFSSSSICLATWGGKANEKPNPGEFVGCDCFW